MKAACHREIIELHQFFEGWLSGLGDASNGEFQRLESVLSGGFQMIGTGGKIVGRDHLLQGLRAAHGARPGLRISVSDIDILMEDGPFALVVYIEDQHTGDETKSRRSTVLFRKRRGTPNGVEWVHVHETWIEAER